MVNIILFCALAYMIIGLIIAEIGFNYLRKKYPAIINQMQQWQFLFVYVVFMIFWMPATIEVIFTKGFKDENF